MTSMQKQVYLTLLCLISICYAAPWSGYYDSQGAASDYAQEDTGDEGHSGGGYDGDYHNVNEHVEVIKPEAVPHFKHVVIPIPKSLEVKVKQQILVPVPHPYPFEVPVHKAVVIPVVKEVFIPIERTVPYPVEKKVPYPVEKKVPYKVEKTITVPVEKPVPFKVPVFQTIIHKSKGHH